MKKIYYLSILLFAALPLDAQFVLSGELRPKTEYRDGYKTLLEGDQKPALITAQRSRLNFSYTGDKIATKVSVQDVRTWGEGASKSDISNLNLFEAWAEVFFTDALSLRLGRQVLSYDQNRFLGTANWNDVGASHDLAQLIYNKNFGLQLGLAYNNDKSKNYESNYPVANYKTLAFLRAEKDLGSLFNLSVISIADGYQLEDDPTVVYQQLTTGLNLNMSNDSIRSSLYGSLYYQGGTYKDGTPVSAWFASLNYGYKFSGKTSMLLAGEYFSGDDAYNDNGVKNSFTNLYGNGHLYYGYMDYFSTIDKDTENGGLMDLYARLNYKFSKKTSSELTCHYFSLANNIVDTLSTPGVNQPAPKYLGTEIDLVLKYKMTSSLEIQGGYSAMLATPTMEILKGGDHSRYQQWLWVMLTFKPEFINTKK
ncbi:MAG: alginate export family protein [Bacteroidota bacterium]